MLTFGELLEHMCGAFFVKGFQCTILSCSSVKAQESSTLGSGADLGTARNKYCNCAGRLRVICSGSAFCHVSSCRSQQDTVELRKYIRACEDELLQLQDRERMFSVLPPKANRTFFSSVFARPFKNLAGLACSLHLGRTKGGPWPLCEPLSGSMGHDT